MGRLLRVRACAAGLVVLALISASGSVLGQNTPVTAQTVLDLYGDSVEPWDSTRTAAMQQAAAQSVGHGVTAGQVSVNVVTTYSQQQGRRRLRASQLVQPGVQLAMGVPTTESLVADIQSAMAGAVGSNQLVNAYKAQNGLQADYTSLVSQATLDSSGKTISGSGSGSSPSPTGGSTATGGSSKGGGSSFPTWAVVVIVLLALALISIGAGYWAYRKWQVRKAIRAEAAKASGYFANVPLPRGGKFPETADRPPRLAFKDYSQRDGHKESLTGAAVPVSAGTPRAGDGPVPAYVPERRGRLVDTLRGIGRI